MLPLEVLGEWRRSKGKGRKKRKNKVRALIKTEHEQIM